MLFIFFGLSKFMCKANRLKQECIPVGCVPTACLQSVIGGGGCIKAAARGCFHAVAGGCIQGRVLANTRLLVHKHVNISVDKWILETMDEWILETTSPQKNVKFLEQYIPQIFNQFVCSMCGQVNFGVDEWLFLTTHPQYKCLKIFSERPEGVGCIHAVARGGGGRGASGGCIQGLNDIRLWKYYLPRFATLCSR